MDGLLRNWIVNVFSALGFGGTWADILTHIAMVVLMLLLSALAWLAASRLAIKLIERIVNRTKNTWDNLAYEQGVFRRVLRVVPAAVLWFMAPIALGPFPRVLDVVRSIMEILIIVVVTTTMISILNFLNALYSQRKDAARRPIKGLVQALQVVLIAAAVLVAFSAATGKPVGGLLGGLGAVSAVLMLVFKDPILGLVSGFQLSSTDMVRIGDWIEVPTYGADGDVIDIGLVNVTVRNFDKTYTTVPIQALTSGAFKNWRGMTDAGARRIKRALSIDLSSVRFLKDEEVEDFRKIALLVSYIQERTLQIAQANAQQGADRNASPLNGRGMTNIGMFRAYAKAYVGAHPGISNDMTLLVRHLEPGPQGLPIELYIFSKDPRWAEMENLQADIFDHLIASLSHFGLAAFQDPAGRDLRYIGRQIAGDGIQKIRADLAQS